MDNYGIIVARFNDSITERLLELCLKGFKEQGIEPEVVRVPGAFEIPIAAQELIKRKHPKALVALGCVIKGDTDHYDQVNAACRDGILRVSLTHHTPIVFEVLMVDSFLKAEARLQKAYDAAFVATEMGKLIHKH